MDSTPFFLLSVHSLLLLCFMLFQVSDSPLATRMRDGSMTKRTRMEDSPLDMSRTQRVFSNNNSKCRFFIPGDPRRNYLQTCVSDTRTIPSAHTVQVLTHFETHMTSKLYRLFKGIERHLINMSKQVDHRIMNMCIENITYEHIWYIFNVSQTENEYTRRLKIDHFDTMNNYKQQLHLPDKCKYGRNIHLCPCQYLVLYCSHILITLCLNRTYTVSSRVMRNQWCLETRVRCKSNIWYNTNNSGYYRRITNVKGNVYKDMLVTISCCPICVFYFACKLSAPRRNLFSNQNGTNTQARIKTLPTCAQHSRQRHSRHPETENMCERDSFELCTTGYYNVCNLIYAVLGSPLWMSLMWTHRHVPSIAQVSAVCIVWDVVYAMWPIFCTLTWKEKLSQ